MQAPVPAHVAIIMDGNGRWARRRNKPRHAGHQAGVRATRGVIESCLRHGVQALTLFAFSSENWRRPGQEVSKLMDLFVRALSDEIRELHENDVRIRFIGGRGAFSEKLQQGMREAEDLTRDNSRLDVVVAVNYGGRGELIEAVRAVLDDAAAGRLDPAELDEARFAGYLALDGLPEPDLFIRTGGERRISNYLLWQLAYTELWFTDVLWPDFDATALDEAIAFYRGRQRRFGRTGEQLDKADHA